jgi:hypothetical protein
MVSAALFMLATAHQPNCAPRAAMEAVLKDRAGEQVVSAGVAASGIVYVMANPVTSSFTVLLLRADGLACMLLSGHGWAVVEPAVPGEDL